MAPPRSRPMRLSRALARARQFSHADSSADASGCRSTEPNASTTVRLARSPASCPPIPSATAQTPASGRTRKLSSLRTRTLPACVAAPVSNITRLPGSILGIHTSCTSGLETAAQHGGEQVRRRHAPAAESHRLVALSAHGPPEGCGGIDGCVIREPHGSERLRQRTLADFRNGIAKDPCRLVRTAVDMSARRQAQIVERALCLLERYRVIEDRQQKMLRCSEPIVLRINLGWRHRLALISAREQGEREIPPDAVQRRHERTHEGRFAEIGTEPKSPDRRCEKRRDPRVAKALPARRHGRLDPWLPHRQEIPRRIERDEIALGRQLAIKSASHPGPYILLGQRKSLSAGRLNGFCTEPALNWYCSSRPPTKKVATTRSPRFAGEPASIIRNSDHAPLRSSVDGCEGN